MPLDPARLVTGALQSLTFFLPNSYADLCGAVCDDLDSEVTYEVNYLCFIAATSGDQQAYLHYQQQQLKKLEEENMRIRKEQMQKRQQANSGGGFGMAPVTSGGTSFVLDPETGMMVPVSAGGGGETESGQVRPLLITGRLRQSKWKNFSRILEGAMRTGSLRALKIAPT